MTTARLPVLIGLGACLSLTAACDIASPDVDSEDAALRGGELFPEFEHPVLVDGLMLESTDTQVTYLALTLEEGAVAELRAHLGAEEAVLASCTANEAVAGGLFHYCSVELEIPEWAWQATSGKQKHACPELANAWLDLSNYVFDDLSVMPGPNLGECIEECMKFPIELRDKCVQDLCTEPKAEVCSQ